MAVGDSARASAASRALRAVATSDRLARVRGAGEYVLRRHGVVRALGTAFGRRRWPSAPPGAGQLGPAVSTPRTIVPQQLEVAVRRTDLHVLGQAWTSQRLEEARWSAVSQPVVRAVHSGVLCDPGLGSFLEYRLPFQLRIGSFEFDLAIAAKLPLWTGR